jgi:hypothetical protein
MPVKLTGNNRPAAWGNRVKGKNIPFPPEENPPNEYVWDGETWVHNPRNESSLERMENSEIATGLENGEKSAKEVLVYLLKNNRI